MTAVHLIALLDSFSITPPEHALNGRYDGCHGDGPQVDTLGTLDAEVSPVWMRQLVLGNKPCQERYDVCSQARTCVCKIQVSKIQILSYCTGICSLLEYLFFSLI